MASNPDRRQLLARSTVSYGAKHKEVLWNVTEPGDPYDIRKSMIARLPGEEKRFMGQHTELVCLLQAAEIERLHEYLQQYRERYLELERRELDRHSYQIQIKELTQRISNGDQYAIENNKLKAFISKLQAEVEDLRRNGSSDLASRYQSLLQSMSTLRDQNGRIKHENQSLRYQVDSLASQLQAFQKTKSEHIHSLQMRLDQATYNASKVSSLSGIREKLENEILALQRENQRLSDTVQMKNHEIQDLFSINASLQKQTSEQKLQSTTISQYENKVALLSQEIDRLNYILRDKSSKFDELTRDRINIESQLRLSQGQKSKFDEEIRRRNSQLEGMRLIIGQLEQDRKNMSVDRGVVEQYDKKLRSAGSEIERLDNKLRTQITEKNKLFQDYNQLLLQMNKIPMLERENEEVKAQLGDIFILRRNIAEYENKVALLSTELERLRGTSDQYRLAKEENDELRNENGRLRSELDRMDRSWNDKHNTEITRVHSEFERKISSIASQNNILSQKKISEAGDEITRLNDLLTRFGLENEAMKTQNEELVSLLNKRDVQIRNLNIQIDSSRNQLEQSNNIRRGVSERDAKILSLQTQLDRTRRNLQQLDASLRQKDDYLRNGLESQRKISSELNQYKSRTMQTTEELQRLSQNREALLRQIESLRTDNNKYLNKIREFEMNHQSLNRDTERYKQMVSSANTEKEMFQRDYSELRNQNERLKRNTGDIEDLKSELAYLKRQYDSTQAELDKARRSGNEGIINVTNTYESKITQYDQKIINLQAESARALEEIQRLQGLLREREAKADSLQYQLNSLRSTEELNRNLNVDLRRDVQKLKSDSMNLRRELEDSENLHKKKDEKLMDLLQEVDRLDGLLERRQKQGYDKDMRVQSLNSENQQIKSREGFIQKDLQFYRRENQALKQRVESLHREITEIQSKFQLLNTELDRLQDLVGQKDSAIKLNERRTKDKEDILANIERQLRETVEARRVLESKVTQSSYTITRHQNSQKENEVLIDSLRRQLDALRNDLIKTQRNLQAEINSLRSQKVQLENELARHNQEYHQKTANFDRVMGRVGDLQKKYTALEKKKKITEINEQDALARIVFLESETLRLKKEKDRIQNKDILELKIEIEKLLAENLNLKNYNDQLTKELDLRNAYHDKQHDDIRESYEKKIMTMEIDLDNLRKNTFTKDAVKGIIQKANDDVVKRNEFYEDEIRRTKEEGFERNRKLQDDVHKLMDDLQRGENMKLTLEEKVRFYEQTIDSLDKKIDRLMEELNNRQSQIREANARYSQYKSRTQELEVRLKHEADISLGLKSTNDFLGQQNNRFKKEIESLKSLEWRSKDYQTSITMLQQNLNQLEDYNKRIGKDYNQQNQRYRDVVATVREFQELLELLSSKFRQLQSELQNVKAENTHLLQRLGETGEYERKASNFQHQNRALKEKIQKVHRDREADSRFNQQANNNLKNSYETKILNLDQVIVQLTKDNEVSKGRIRDTEELRRRAQALSEELRVLKEENSRYSKSINAHLQEIRSLKEANSNWRANEEGTRGKINDLMAEIDRLNKLLDKSHAEAEHCLDKSLHENMNLRKRLEDAHNLAAKVDEYERKIQELKTINQRLSEQVNGRSRAHGEDLDRLRFIDQENRKNKQMIDSLKDSLSLAEKSMNMTKTSFSVEAQELRRKTNSIPELQNRISSLERELANSQNELSGLRKSGGIKEEEILRTRRENQELVNRSDRDRQAILEDYRKLQAQYNTLLREYDGAKKRAGQNDERMKQVYTEFDRLQEIINRLKSERTSIIEKNRVLGGEIDRLSAANKVLEGNVEDYRLKIADMITLEKRLQEQLALIVVLFAQIESLRGQLANRENQLAEAQKDSLTSFRL